MSRLDETATCGSSRELVRKFLDMSVQERDAMADEEKTRMALAFHHVELCLQGYGMPNLCNKLWVELRTMTSEKDENGDQNAKYDPQVALYMVFAKYPLHDELGTENNPLKIVNGRRKHAAKQPRESKAHNRNSDAQTGEGNSLSDTC